ncbi:hypothetical protein QZN01_30215 [Burkholderia cenocepacia]|jgi:hypothetical protein|uniref:hypothetical protein n=1 Tax=Burkholderia TaxID=32008 RepID=UPI00023439AA|nr:MULTISPECIES: hypothetical protein [Burkholderia]AQQ37669.1 hypothetical protein A8E75_01105 [Burkholderia cenocepacia]MBG0880691.1 hypothetical protein [Burkholderia sp. 9775_39]MBG0886719.1 hypothetical protein [Burkholderia sp. 9773_38]MBR8095557.1 hypothetical protein [Burkholderia cenocepacia]MBR8138457.1 hypothetical protein [Burkholderia cenocepacia]
MSAADFLVKGTVIGMVASAATVGMVHVAVEFGTRWSSSGMVVTMATALLMAMLLLVPPLVTAWRNRKDVVDPFYEPAALKPMLQGRTIGIVVGIVFGISIVTGW